MGPAGNVFQCWSPLYEKLYPFPGQQDYDGRIRDYFVVEGILVALTERGTLYRDTVPLHKGLTCCSVIDAATLNGVVYIAVAEGKGVRIWAGDENFSFDEETFPQEEHFSSVSIAPTEIFFGTNAGRLMSWVPEEPEVLYSDGSIKDGAIDRLHSLIGEEALYLVPLPKGPRSWEGPFFALNMGSLEAHDVWAPWSPSLYQDTVLNNRLVIWEGTGLTLWWEHQGKWRGDSIKLDTSGIPDPSFRWDWSTWNFLNRTPPIAHVWSHKEQELFVARSGQGLHNIYLDRSLMPGLIDFGQKKAVSKELLYQLGPVENSWVVASSFGSPTPLLVTNTGDGLVHWIQQEGAPKGAFQSILGSYRRSAQTATAPYPQLNPPELRPFSVQPSPSPRFWRRRLLALKSRS